MAVPAVLATLLPPSRRLALGAALAIVLGACSPAGPTPVPSSAPTPTASGSAGPSPATSPGASGAASLLLEVRHVGGFINPTSTIGTPAAVVVDTDGRIYTPHADASEPRPMIPAIDVRDTGAAGAAAVLGAARDAGLAQGGSTGLTGDAGTTVFTLVTPDGAEVVTRVGSVGPGLPGVPGGSSGGSSGPGAAATALLARLTDPAAPWPPSATPATRFEPTAYEVWVAPEDAGGVGSATTAWPLATDPNLFGAPAASPPGVAGLRSGAVRGADAATLTRVLGRLTAGNDLAYQGHAYRVWVRPLLPDELGS